MVSAANYAGLVDLEPLLAFASRALCERRPLNGTWHPGDVIWALKPDYEGRNDFRLWRSGQTVEAVMTFVGPNEVWLEALPQNEEMIPEMVAWAESQVKRRAPEGAPPSLSIRGLEGDSRRSETLGLLGYQTSGADHVWFRRDLGLPLPTATAVAGFRAQDAFGVDPVARARVHRDAWNHLDNIGIENATSSFSTETYLSLKGCVFYDPSLDILVSTEAGDLVANCICWADPISLIGLFEPVGTHFGYRGRGLARMLILEGMARLRDKGMIEARVGTAHFNAPAIATYLSCGFELYDRTVWWTKSLG